MANSVKPRQPIQAPDLFSNIRGLDDVFTKVETPRETTSSTNFRKEDYPYATEASPEDNPESLSIISAGKQPLSTIGLRTLKQFGANTISSFGQGLANTFDLSSQFKSLKGDNTDDYNSSLFGITAREMQNWAQGIAERNQILQQKPGKFDPTDIGWWSNQIASSGTGIGMGLEALATTIGIEYATDGLGTETAIAKLGNLFNKLKKTRTGLEALGEAANTAKSLKSAATIYGVMNRIGESRMEAQNTYDQIYKDLSNEKNEDGTDKYTEQQKVEAASKGAARDYHYNLALLPLDILSYRTMVFNPISGTGEGFVERGLEKIAGIYGKSAIGKGAGWLTTHAIGSQLEGLEEGFQQFGQDEGERYAKVLSGETDNRSYLERLGEEVTSDDFWNNYAGGVIGSPIIGGVMNLVDQSLHGKQRAALAQVHKDYISNIGRIDSSIASQIRDLQSQGKDKEASILRRQFSANKVISALHLDAMTNKTTAFDSRQAFIDGTLDELNSGKLDALNDLGFHNPTKEQLDSIKKEFEDYSKDAEQIKNIYDKVKYSYNKNLVPQIVNQHYQLSKLIEEQPNLRTQLELSKNNLPQYNELSSNGKLIHDTEYQLHALKLEEGRLSRLYSKTKDSDEKENIARLQDINKAKIEDTNKRLEDISKDESYDTNTKNIDNDILGSLSTLKNIEYLSNVYQNERLNNEVSLLRNNIALWNNPKYSKNKLSKVASNATTIEQLDNLKENKEEVDIPAAENTRSKILADEASKTVENENEVVLGNDNLFAEDNQNIDNLSSATNDLLSLLGTTPDEIINNSKKEGNQPEFVFSPTTYDFNNSPEIAKIKIKNAVEGLLNKIGNNANTSFEDLVRHVVKLQGLDTADKIFNALKYGWEGNGRDKVDYDAVYNKIFGNPIDELIDGISQLLIQTPQQLDTATNNIVEDVISKQDTPVTFDNNNQPVYRYKGIVTNESLPKLSFVTRLSNINQSINEDGSITISHEYSENDLNTSGYIDSLPLLDPDKYNEGDKLEAVIPSNYNDILIPIYNQDGTKGKAITFGQYVSQNNLNPTSQEYQDKVPIIIYNKGYKQGDKGLAFVHDIGWYHPIRFNQEHPDDMKNAIESTRAIRKEVLESNGKKTTLTITSKRQTTFEGLKTDVDKNITLKEANPQTTLALVLDSTDPNSLYTSKDKQFGDNNNVLMNTKPFSYVGQIIDIRRYGLKDGKRTYMGFPVLRSKIDDITKTSILRAINIYANRTNKDTNIRDKHDRIAKQINDTMGIDIKSATGLEKYLQHFINTFNTEKARSNQDVEQQAKTRLEVGTPYIAFIAGGNIVFGQAGIKQTTTISSFYINPNSSNNSLGLGKLNTNPIIVNGKKYNNILGWYEQNLNLNNLNDNKPIVTIDNNDIATVTSPSYRDFLLDRLMTNVKSYNIGTQENPNYVTNIQPVITYDTNKRLQKILAKETTEEIKEEVTQTGGGTVDERTQSDVQEELNIEKELEKARKLLGGDLGASRAEYNLSPSLLTEAQSEVIAKSIDKIAGLTSKQQYDIVSFMYNQILPLVEANKGSITLNESNKAVDRAFNDIVIPIREETKQEFDRLNKLLETNPNLKDSSIPDVINDLKLRLDKIDSISDNLGILKSLAYNEVSKYTNIKINKAKVEDDRESAEESEDIPDEEESGRSTDFWTDILTESPENKVTKRMRRFLGQIREYDKNGNPITGFLNLPTYLGLDHIIRTLMTNLVDIPSNFDDMINKLDSLSDSIKWMPEVIRRLKEAGPNIKNSFVTMMSNTSLRMKFTLIGFDRLTGTWFSKAKDTNTGGIADAIRKSWINNFETGSLLTHIDENGNLILNNEKANKLIDEFKSWKGLNLRTVESDMNVYWKDFISKVTNDISITFTPEGQLLQEFKTNIVKKGDKLSFNLKGHQYQVSSVGDNKYKIEYLKQTTASKQDINKWLNTFGINLSTQTLDELYSKGLYHNTKQRNYPSLFQTGENTNGLFGILYNKLVDLSDPNRKGVVFDEEGNSPLGDTVIASLANLEAKYNNSITPFGFRDSGKSLFAISARKFITDRAIDLKSEDDTVRNQLKQISFSNQSIWLRLLDDSIFREKFGVFHLGLTAIKQLGKRNYRDNSIQSISPIDHELCKLGQFQDTKLKKINVKYPDTNIPMRMANMFSPTMESKHIMTLTSTAILDLTTKDLLTDKGISDDVVKAIYEQTVKPELQRMIKFYQNGGSTNIDSYDKGAGLFLLMPEMNNIVYAADLKLIDAIKHKPNTFTLDYIEGNTTLRDKFNTKIREYVDNLVNDKLRIWKDMGNLEQFFDNSYFNGDRFRGNLEEKTKMAAQDFVINSLISNANSFMLFAGDPAMYYKSKSSDINQRVEDTYTNTLKRLANQIAPGASIANSKGDRYIQVFLNDRLSKAENLSYIERLFGKDSNEYRSYSKIEGSDAQEYSTWKEHLDIMSKLGKSNDNLIDITQEELDEAADIFSKNIPINQLTSKQKDILTKVVQPIKPVYTGQIYDKTQDVMRTMYIKSSSFPLIPQLTQGFEIDKLRLALEKLQKERGLNVRASYQTANKVGAITNRLNVWNEDGTANTDELGSIGDKLLVLDRNNFRIQQDIPFKSASIDEDTVTLGTQLMKLLFGDDILSIDGFNYNGETVSGKELFRLYTDLFNNLLTNKRDQLYSELGLDSSGIPKDSKFTQDRLHRILKDEATKRNYPLQDIEGLSIREDGQFNLPLWASANSNRYESMLNSIISNRLVRIKMPGSSYVVGSEEGFYKKKSEDSLTTKDKSRIIYTSAWNGQRLQSTSEKDGKISKAQVFVASKFRDNDGKLIDLMDGYVIKQDNGSYKLDESKFDKELLSLLTFRTPTSSHQSGTTIEIAGFLPYESGDLMIIPSSFTKQKGLDFDVDKESGYQYWTYLNKENKLERLRESHVNEILASTDKVMREGKIESIKQKIAKAEGFDKVTLIRQLNNELANNKLFNNLFQDFIYSEEDIDSEKFLKKLNDKLKEKIIQNKLIDIHHTVYSNPNKELQKKINTTLNTDFVESEAKFIDNLIPKKSAYRTLLSDEYQKNNMILGAASGIGRALYSLDVTFHSLAQQQSLTDKAIQVHQVHDTEDSPMIPLEWKFGNIQVDGKLGNVKTLDGSRSITEVLNERQNMAIDDVKLQVMNRIGINDITMGVDGLFNLLGIDKGEDGHSVSLLFLSQPIIKRYVELIKNSNSIIAEFNRNREEDIINKLLDEFNGRDGYFVPQDYEETFTNANFIGNISSDKPSGNFQGAVLRRFLDMKSYSQGVKTIENAINFKNNSLGKSFFDVIEKRNALNRLASVPIKDTIAKNLVGVITNAHKLIGDYISKDDFIGDTEKGGYVDMGNYYIKPTTYVGSFNILSTNTAYRLWSNYFPYDTNTVQAKFQEILPIIASSGLSFTKTVELKQELFRHMKKFFNAVSTNGILDSTDDINEERKRIFIDSKDNTSLAKYLKQVLQIQDNPAINAFIKTNKLINRFEFDIKNDGQPSLIKFNNAAGEEYDEQYLYESLSSLLTQRSKTGERILLPTIGNKSYTLDTLAQDLVAYCMTGNSTQAAIEFTKYIPMSYLNAVGYSNEMRNINRWLSTDTSIMGDRLTSSDSDSHMVSKFTMQYIQHNPTRVNYKIDIKDLNNKIVEPRIVNKEVQAFKLKSEDNPIFISVYNPAINGDKKFQLYWFDGNEYTRIPVLGTFGMDEYQPKNDIGKSILNRNIKVKAQPQSKINTPINTPQDIFDINKGDISGTLQKIIDNNLESLSELAKQLQPFVSTITSGIKYQDTIPSSGIENSNFDAAYGHLENSIVISPTRTANITPENMSRLILHEVVHGLTINQIKPYIKSTTDGNIELTSNAPIYVSNLARLYNEVRSRVDTKELQDILAKIKNNERLTQEEFSQKYGLTDIYEFMSMAMTQPEFQKYLGSIKTNGISLLDKFKNIIKSILSNIGVKFESDTVAAQAINSIFELIEKENTKISIDDINQQLYEDSFNNDFDNLDIASNDIEDEDISKSISTFPDKKLNIPNNNCI